MKEDELSNQLKSQNLDTVLPSSLKQVGGPVFPDVPTVGGLASFRHVVDSYRAVHLPSYGQPIAGTAETKVIIGVEAFTPASNEVYKLQGFTLENGGGVSNIVLNFRVGSFPLLSNTTIAGGASTTPTILPNLFFDKNTPLNCEILSGSGGDLISTFLLVKVAQ